jgi:hypothetical protein
MTRHLTDDELMLHHYGESDDSVRAAAHLEACATCRATYDAVIDALEAADAEVVPEPGPDYEQRVWERVQPRLAATRHRARVVGIVRRTATFGALAASLVLAFALGRMSRPPAVQVVQPISAPARERILLVAVGEHLERSQMVLIELQNAEPGDTVDISSERQRAADLVPANRLYRSAAQNVGEPGMAGVLDELERVLVEIAASPDAISSQELDGLRRRIEAQGILFKVQVVGSRVRDRERVSSVRGSQS